MCGINGFFSKNPVGREWLMNKSNKMNSTIRHRGPDDKGHYVTDQLALGHVRLSIIDLSEMGHQPMHTDDFVITFNGEIYNYQDLKVELNQLGYQFKSGSDTEVLLYVFEEWGIEGIGKLEGMFAFCILNKKTGIAHLVRDRLGIKPIYYIKQGDFFAFSSELRALESIDFNLEINTDLIPIYLSLLYSPRNQTPYKEIHKLPSGSYLEIDTSNLEFRISKFWSLDGISHNTPSSENNWRNIREVIIKAIEMRLVADVPIGLWLSGGVDSGLIAGITAKELGVKMDTFSIIYPKTYNFFDESERAKIISKEFNHNHQELEINPVHIFDNFDEILYYQEEWIGNPASLLYYHLSKKTKEHVKVVLSGLGGDEVFGGYNRYRALEVASMLSTWPKTLKQLATKIVSFLPQTRLNSLGNYGRALNKIFNALDTDDQNTYIRIISYWENNNVEQLVNLIEKTGDIMNDVMRFDIKNYMQDDLLLLSDKMSMAHGLELRVPLIDNKILEAAFSTNATNRMGRTGKKEFLTNWFKECIGDKLQQGRKMGFSIPVEPFLKKIGKEELNHLIKKSEIKEFVAQTTIDKILNEFFSQGKDYVNEIYALLVLAKWRITRNK